MRPPQVQRAVLTVDRDTLSAMGRKGGKVAARRRATKRLAEVRRGIKLTKELAERAQQANEDGCPVDDD